MPLALLRCTFPRARQDYAALLAVPATLSWWEAAGGLEAGAAHSRALLADACALLAAEWRTPPPVEGGACAAPMALVQLPLGGRAFTPTDGKAVQDRLHALRVEIPVKTINGRLFARVSAAVYNERADYERLAEVVRTTCWEEVLGSGR